MVEEILASHGEIKMIRKYLIEVEFDTDSVDHTKIELPIKVDIRRGDGTLIYNSSLRSSDCRDQWDAVTKTIREMLRIAGGYVI